MQYDKSPHPGTLLAGREPVLASDEDGDSVGRLSFSLASDIVELVILTTDDAFLRTLREAVGGARRLWHVPSADKVSDLLLAGQVGILVLDAQTLHDGASVFVSQIKRQFPDLVVVVAGNRDAESLLASLISAGVVYRFIHKPMSPGRAKLFADAAVRRFDEQRKRLAASPGVARSSPGRLAASVVVGALAAVIAAAWILRHGSSEKNPPQPGTVTDKPAPTESPWLARAAAALADNRLTAPGGDNALELYQQELARDPSDAAARAGLAEVHERLLARAENALLEERLDEAAMAIETARRAGVESGRIAFLSAQLAKSRGQLKAAAQGLSKSNAPPADAGELTLVKSVRPIYPGKARQSQTEGWVELDFTVAESGAVKDIAVHQANPPGVFDNAAIGALSQWRYTPVLRDAKPAAQRARIRIRFTLSG
jgi:TonB family protein